MKSIAIFIVAGVACGLHPITSVAQVPPGQQPPAAQPAASAYTPDQLQTLVGNIALYPDDLLGLVLPASTTPLEIVKAQQFLGKYAQDKSLKPDPSIPEPVLGLMAYPEVVDLMANNLDWAQALGYAVTHQQQDVFDAIQIFRRKAQSAGNLQSNDKQTVIVQQDVVQIQPTQPNVIYVPQYQPTTVVVQQAAPVVTYSEPAPAYYAPGAAAAVGYVAGLATAYSLNWASGCVYHAPYAAHIDYLQEQRIDYANHAREDRQDYRTDAREDWQDYGEDRQKDRQQAAKDNQTQRQDAVRDTTSANQGQRQDALSGAQTQRADMQTQRQTAASNAQAQRGSMQTQRPSTMPTAPQGAQNWQAAAANRQGGWAGAGQYASSGFSGRSDFRQSVTPAAGSPGTSGGVRGGDLGGARSSPSTTGFGATRSGASFGGGGGFEGRSAGGAFGGASSGSQSRGFSERGSRSFGGGGGGGFGGGGGGRSRGGRR